MFPGQILTHVMVGGTAGRRYHAVTLYVNSVAKQRSVHVLVLENFVGDRPAGMQGLHKDDDTHNNVLENLYWGTPSENGKDAVGNGRNWKSNITHCPRGHEYTKENTYVYEKTGHRQCKACMKLKNTGNANKDRTHCPQGHEYTEENTYRPKGSPNRRQCKTCTRDRAREYQRAKRAK